MKKSISKSTRRMTMGLGVFSMGLGLAELLAPEILGNAMGMRRKENLIRLYGLREIMTGALIVTSRNPALWIMARVGGDGLDLATLVKNLPQKGRRRNALLAISAVAGAGIMDTICFQRLRAEYLIPPIDYSHRSGFPRPIEFMRGIANDVKPPALKHRKI